MPCSCFTTPPVTEVSVTLVLSPLAPRLVQGKGAQGRYRSGVRDPSPRQNPLPPSRFVQGLSGPWPQSLRAPPVRREWVFDDFRDRGSSRYHGGIHEGKRFNQRRTDGFAVRGKQNRVERIPNQRGDKSRGIPNEKQPPKSCAISALPALGVQPSPGGTHPCHRPRSQPSSSSTSCTPPPGAWSSHLALPCPNRIRGQAVKSNMPSNNGNVQRTVLKNQILMSPWCRVKCGYQT